MKLPFVFVVTALCVAAAPAEYGTNINSYGSSGRDQTQSVVQDSQFGQDQGKSTKSLRDLDSFNGAQNRQSQNGRNYNGRANQYGQKNAKAAESGNKASQNFAKQDAKYDEVARQIADAGYSQGYQSAAQGKYDNLDDNRARGYNGAAANKKAYNRGKVFNDNISYGFDKKFDQDLTERGGFEEENGHTAHKLDEYRDKQKARKLLRGDHSAANARQDAQHALKESKFSQNAAQKQAANGKYGNSDKKLDKAGATQDAQAVQYDRKDSKFQAEDAGRQQAVKKANEFANKDNAFGRQAAASHAGAQGHADKKYYGGHGNDGNHGGIIGGTAYGNNVVHGSSSGTGTGTHGQGSGGLANHKYGEDTKQVDQGKERLAQAAGATDAALKEYKQAKNTGQFAQLKSLHDQRNGKFAQGVHDAQNNGFNAKDSQAAKTASGGDKRYADAAAQSNAKAAKHDLDEAAFDKENFKRNQQDRNENFKKLKRFYHDKKSGGNNIERLSYNRKRAENEFGETQAAQKDHQNQFDKAHKSAKHNQAQRKDNFQDAKKSSTGFSVNNAKKLSHGNANNQAAAFNKAAQQAYGNKKDVAEADFSNNRDALTKQQKNLHDNAVGSSAATSQGFKNAAAAETVKLGNGGGISGNLISNGAHRTPRRGFEAVNNVHGSDTHGASRPGSVYQGNTNHFDNVGDNSFGGYRGDQHRGRALGSVGSFNSGYGNNRGHGDSFGSSFGGFNDGFGNFGSFGQNKGNSFGGTYASKSGGRSSVPHRGGDLSLFGSGFSSFGGSSSFGAKPQFGFRHSAKGSLY